MANDPVNDGNIKSKADAGAAWKQAAPGLFPAVRPAGNAPTTHLEDLAMGTLKGRFSQETYVNALMDAEPPGSPPMGTQKIPESLDDIEPTGTLGPNYQGMNNQKIQEQYRKMNPELGAPASSDPAPGQKPSSVFKP